MKSVLFVCAMLFGGAVALAADAPVSVLNHGQPTPADGAAATTATAPAVTGARRTRCANGRCCTGPNCQMFNVEESAHEIVRPRLFGGQVIRRGNRTVVRPVR